MRLRDVGGCVRTRRQEKGLAELVLTPPPTPLLHCRVWRPSAGATSEGPVQCADELASATDAPPHSDFALLCRYATSAAPAQCYTALRPLQAPMVPRSSHSIPPRPRITYKQRLRLCAAAVDKGPAECAQQAFADVLDGASRHPAWKRSRRAMLTTTEQVVKLCQGSVRLVCGTGC